MSQNGFGTFPVLGNHWGKILDKFFDLESFDKKSEYDWIPKTDVDENEQEFIIQMDVPSLTKDDITIEIQDGVLEISGKRNIEKKENGRYERNSGKFIRRWNVDNLVNEDDINASYENGVLKLLLPKKKEVIEQEKRKRIEIK